MAYRSNIGTAGRGGAVIAAIAINALVLLAFLHLGVGADVPGAESVMRVFNLAQPPPPPPPPPPQQKPQPKPRDKAAAAAPPNIRSEATPVEAPKPKVVIPPVPQIAASATPRQGTMPTQGAAPFPGPGTGAGGTGNGHGSGAGGNGTGGGGENGVAEPPHLTSPVLTGRDIPRDLLDEWPQGATVFMRLKVDARGYVSECNVDRGTGVPAIDSAICNIAHDRLRFRPALNRSGQPVAGWFGYAQRAPH